MKIKCSSFSEGEMIPSQYTCDGLNISPPLTWEGVPGGTKSLALICDDPDAPMGTWVHWVLYDLPAHLKGLPESVEAAKNPQTGGTHGINDFHKPGYGGPCPPAGTHRYFFKLYALDIVLKLPTGATKKHVEAKMTGHILAEAKLMGRYSRR